MTSENHTLPYFVKASLLLTGCVALLGILYVARGIIVPIVFSGIIAILLHPFVNVLIRLKINRVIAIVLVLTLSCLIIIAFGVLMVTQISRFTDSWPVLVDKFGVILNDTITWISDYFAIEPQKIDEWITHSLEDLISINSELIGQTLITVGSGLVLVFLVPVYVFLILYYQPLLLEFIFKFFGTNNHDQVKEIVGQIKTVIQRYLIGLIIEAVLVAILDTAALLILGIQYAVLLGIIGALLNVIPYIGGLVAVAIPMMIAIVTKSSAWYAIYVLIAYYFIQLVDNNYIVPKIVASKVKINALFSIIVVIAGNALWGIPGMFLSLPLLAIVKLISDHVESLKPWGFLLGDSMPSLLTIKPFLKKLKIKAS